MKEERISGNSKLHWKDCEMNDVSGYVREDSIC